MLSVVAPHFAMIGDWNSGKTLIFLHDFNLPKQQQEKFKNEY
jgi:hypothetical protein